MADVFISYAREDISKARLLAEALIADGLSVWWDHDLVGGDNFRQQIDDTIANAKCVIVIWSEASTKSPFVKDEASRANDRQILLPVAVGEVSPPVGFGELQTIRFKRWAETTAEWESLVRTVHARLREGGIETKSERELSNARRQLAFFGRNIDVFLLTLFAQGLACFLLFQPLHFFEYIAVEAKICFVIILSLLVSGFQSWILIANKSGLTLRAVSFVAGIFVGLCAYYFSGASLEQISIMLNEEIGAGGGISLFNGFVFFVYILVWGTVGVLTSD